MRSSIVVVAFFLAACADRGHPAAVALPEAAKQAPGRAADPTAHPGDVGPPADSKAALPGDACTVEGYWSFFEAFVRTPGLRHHYSDEAGREALPRFDIAQQDSRWVRASAPHVALDVIERREDTTFEVVATPVELDANDDVIRRLDVASHYRFQFKDACWRFVGMK